MKINYNFPVEETGILLALNLDSFEDEKWLLQDRGFTQVTLVLGKYNNNVERGYFIPYQDAKQLTDILQLAYDTEQDVVLYCGESGVRSATRINRFYVDEMTPRYDWVITAKEYPAYTMSLENLNKYILVDDEGRRL
jgi:hypothetical protein